MGQLATRNSHHGAADARRAHLTRAATTPPAADDRSSSGDDGRSSLAVTRRALPAAFAALVALILVSLAPAAARAQSGRKPQPTPTPERPRRVPAQKEQPGQPATPDAPSTTPAPAAPGPAATTRQPSDDPQSVEEIDPDEVMTVHSNLVPVSANVSDAGGRAVTDLKLEDFELRVDGQTKPISDLSFAETPVRLALLFDNSSSVRPTRELEKHAAVRFLRTVLRPVDQAALFSISTYPSLDHPLTPDASKIARIIEAYGEVEGSTALFDTIIAATEYLRPMPGRKVIVIVSDGAETTSKITDFGEVLRRSLAADCQVFVIQTGLSDNANLRDLFAERRMQDLTSHTGGAVYAPKVSADLDAAFAHIAADLSQQYVLSYYPTDDGSDGRFRAISLRVKTRPNMKVRARRGFYPRRHAAASAAQPNYAVEVASAVSTHAVEPEPAAPQPPPASASPAPARQQAAAVAARGPLHGSKNLDPGDEAPDARPASDARPVVRFGNLPPAREQAVPEPTSARPEPMPSRSETKLQTPAAIQTSVVPASHAPAERDSSNPSTKDSTRDSSHAEPDGESASRDAAKSPPTNGPPGSTERVEPKSTPPQSSTAQAARASVSEPPLPSAKPALPSQSQPPSQTAPQPNQQPAAPRAPISGGVLNGRATSLPRPQYPERARRAGVAGTVSVEVTIDESGKVIAARAVSGPMMLRGAAEQAARQARFTPALLSGKPVQMNGVINYNFNL